MEVYTDEELKLLQTIELSILKDFIEICKQNKLKYFLAGGSAIGAVRHNGFIPWDDDIDVAMPRKDYDQLLSIIGEKYQSKYCLVNNETHPDFPLMNTRLCLRGTQFVLDDVKNLKHQEDFGIFLDIFCQDNMPDEKKEFKKQGTRAWIWGKFMVLSGVKKPVLYMKGIKRLIVRICCYIGYYVLKIIHLKPAFFYKRAKKWMIKYQCQDTERFGYMFDPSRFTSVLYKKDVFPTRTMKFEDIEVQVPKKVETYLTNRFGDYMKLPPKGDRHMHPPFRLDFGDLKTKYSSKEDR